jgi:hypothetical protein
MSPLLNILTIVFLYASVAPAFDLHLDELNS